MELGHTRITAQGQTSVPSLVRKRFGLGPGSELSWQEVDGVLVLKSVKFTLEDFAALLPAPPEKPVTIEAMDQAIVDAVRERLNGGR